MDSEPVNVKNLLYAEKTRIAEEIMKAMATAPSLRGQKKLLKRISVENLSFEEVSSLPGIVVFTEPHLYGLALRMVPGSQERSEETFRHEVDHFNEGRERGVKSGRLGISFGANRTRKGVVKKGNWVGFYLYNMPDGLTKLEQKEAGRFITSAPENLSKGDKKRLKE